MHSTSFSRFCGGRRWQSSADRLGTASVHSEGRGAEGGRRGGGGRRRGASTEVGRGRGGIDALGEGDGMGEAQRPRGDRLLRVLSSLRQHAGPGGGGGSGGTFFGFIAASVSMILCSLGSILRRSKNV